MKPRDDKPDMPPAPDASTLPPAKDPATAATAVAAPPKDVLPPAPKDDKEKAALEERRKLEESNKKIAALKEDWAKHNSRRWTNIKNPDALAVATTSPASLFGKDRPVVDYESGYYQLDGKENKHLAILHLFQDPKTGQWSVNICKNPGTYEDYGNGRDLLQSQGCTQITYDYPDVYDVDPTKTVKFMLDSIYKNAENYDDRGNLLPGKTADDFKPTPAAISLGPTVHKYIEQNIGYLNSKNPFLRKRAEQCQKMLQLETLSLQKHQEHTQGLKAASATSTATKTVETEETYSVPAPPPPPPGSGVAARPVVPDAPGPGADPGSVTTTATASTTVPDATSTTPAATASATTPDATVTPAITRTPESPAVETPLVAQRPQAELDSGVNKRTEEMITAAKVLSEQLQALTQNPDGKDVFEADEIENIKKVTNLLERVPDLSEADKQDLKHALKEYVDESRKEGKKQVDLSDSVKGKFDEVIKKADAANNKELGDKLLLVKEKYEENAPLKTNAPKLGGD